MKLQIEITEAEIKAAIERKIRAAIADESNSYSNEQWLKQQVAKLWKETAIKAIEERLADLPAMRTAITSTIEARLKAQIAAVMKKGGSLL